MRALIRVLNTRELRHEEHGDRLLTPIYTPLWDPTGTYLRTIVACARPQDVQEDTYMSLTFGKPGWVSATLVPNGKPEVERDGSDVEDRQDNRCDAVQELLLISDDEDDIPLPLTSIYPHGGNGDGTYDSSTDSESETTSSSWTSEEDNAETQAAGEDCTAAFQRQLASTRQQMELDADELMEDMHKSMDAMGRSLLILSLIHI